MGKKRNSEQRVLFVGCDFKHAEADSGDFYTDKHCLDYSVVFLDPLGAFEFQKQTKH